MSKLVVDASVWIATQDTSDIFSKSSRLFLNDILNKNITVHVPAFARVEVACALARRIRDAQKAVHLTNKLFNAVDVKEHSINSSLLTAALTQGTEMFLRAADALYVATAESLKCELISWDKEHIKRAQALSPSEWMQAHP